MTAKGWGPVCGVLLSGLWLCYITATLPPMSKFSPTAYVRRDVYGAPARRGEREPDMLELLGRPFFAADVTVQQEDKGGAGAPDRVDHDIDSAPRSQTPDLKDGLGVTTTSVVRIAAAAAAASANADIETWVTAFELQASLTEPQPQPHGQGRARPPMPQPDKLSVGPATDPTAPPPALAADLVDEVAGAFPAAPAPSPSLAGILAKFTERTFDTARDGSGPVLVTLESLSKYFTVHPWTGPPTLPFNTQRLDSRPQLRNSPVPPTITPD